LPWKKAPNGGRAERHHWWTTTDGADRVGRGGVTAHENVSVAELLEGPDRNPGGPFLRSSANQVQTADGNPISFASGEPYTLALLICWTGVSGAQGIFRSGSSSSGNWLWMLSSGKLWDRHERQ
jgi:hypothetical protein